MKPLILETRSVCAALSVFPRAAPRFLSAMFKLSFVCCWATTDSCGVSCGAIVGASDFSASLPKVPLDGALLRGRGGGGRKPIKRPRNGGISNRSSGNGSSNASFPSAMRACATGLTITAVAHGISGRFLTLHPTNRHVAQQKRKNCERSEEHTSELQSLTNLVCRLLLEKKK